MPHPKWKHSDPVHSGLAATLGFISFVLFQTERSRMRLAMVFDQIWPAVLLGQVEISFDVNGRPTGFALWAYLTDEVAAELAASPARTLHLSEWNEGTNVWIMDMVVLNGRLRELVASLKAGPLKGAMRVRGLRRDPNGSVRKIADLRRRLAEPAQ